MAIPIESALSDAEVLQAWTAGVCPACGAAKSSGQAFCRPCFLALTIWQRRSLEAAPERCLQQFRAALRHLQLNRGRLPRWPYRSASELEAAGFRFSRYGRCGAPGCYGDIVWYITPQGKYLAINFPEERGPHRASCKDPEYFERRRQARAAARHRRKRA